MRGLYQAQRQRVYLVIKAHGCHQSLRRRTGPGFSVDAGEFGAGRQSARQLLITERQTGNGNLKQSAPTQRLADCRFRSINRNRWLKLAEHLALHFIRKCAVGATDNDFGQFLRAQTAKYFSSGRFALAK